MIEPISVDVSYEGSGYDTVTLRAVATVTTGKGKQVFRGSWAHDDNASALKSLINKIVSVTLKQIDDDQARHLEESDIMRRKIEGLQAEIDQVRNEATRSGLSTLMARSKDVQHQRNLLQVEVTKQRAKLARIDAAVSELTKALNEL